MNTVSLTLLYSDKIKFTVTTAKMVTIVFVTAGKHRVKGAVVFLVLKTYNFFV